MKRMARRLTRSRLAIPLIALGVSVFAIGSTAVALTTVSETVRGGATTKTTVFRYDPGGGQSTNSTAFQDIIPGQQATITFTKPSILLVTLTAESSCYSSVRGNASYCTARILVDGIGELGPGTGVDFAFDSTDFGNDTQFSWEGHAMQRSSNVLPPGTYTIRPQYAVQGPAVFQIDDVHETVQAITA